MKPNLGSFDPLNVAGSYSPTHWPGGGELPHSRLWSMQDLMKRFGGRWVAWFIDGLRINDPKNYVPLPPKALKSAKDHQMSDKNRQNMRDTLKQGEEYLQQFGFAASMVTIRKMYRFLDLPKLTMGDYNDLCDELRVRLMDEFDEMHLLALDATTKHFWTGKQLFGQEVEARFPSTANDIEEAGKCLALGRGTACVFHLMRVLETGVQEFGAKLGVTLLDAKGAEKNWHNILEEVNKAIKALAKGDARAPMLAELSALLHAVKLAWRNEVMHPKAEYTEEQAEDVFRATRAFMRMVAEACAPAAAFPAADRTSAPE